MAILAWTIKRHSPLSSHLSHSHCRRFPTSNQLQRAGVRRIIHAPGNFYCFLRARQRRDNNVEILFTHGARASNVNERFLTAVADPPPARGHRLCIALLHAPVKRRLLRDQRNNPSRLVNSVYQTLSTVFYALRYPVTDGRMMATRLVRAYVPLNRYHQTLAETAIEHSSTDLAVKPFSKVYVCVCRTMITFVKETECGYIVFLKNRQFYIV